MRGFLPLALFTIVAVGFPQTKTVTLEDAKKWEALAGAAISPDGRFLAYRINLVDGDGRVVIRNVDTPDRKEVIGGGPVTFSDDSKWAAYLISPPREVADRLRTERKPIKTKLALFSLVNGSERIIDDVQRFRFTKGGRYLLAHRFRPETRKEGGSDLTLIDLSDVTPLTFGNVEDVEPNESGTLLAMRVVPESGESSVQTVEMGTGKMRTLYWGVEKVGPLAWAAKADVLTYLVGARDEKKDGEFFRVVVARDLTAPKATQTTLDPKSIATFPAGQRITDYLLDAGENGTVVSVGVQNWRDKSKPAGKPEDRAGLEIWNTKDVDLIPLQRVREGAERRRTTLYVWRVADNVTQLVGGSKFQDASLLPKGDYALIQDATPYVTAAGNGVEYADYSLLDTRTGTLIPIAEKLAGSPAPSRTGAFLTYFQGRDWWLYDVAKRKATNLTASTGVSFLNPDYDGTSPIKPPADDVDWLAQDAGAVLYDKFDAWLYRPIGGLSKLTEGRKEQTTYRLVTISQKEIEEGVALDGTMHFRIFDEETKGNGFYATDAKGKGKVLIFDNATFRTMRRAEEADRAMFTLETPTKSPDIYITNLAFSQAKPVTKLNPFQSEFAWSKNELITYKSRFGKALQGVLMYPAGYVPGRQYPMVTYIYEKLSQGLNTYTGPNPWNPYNAQMLAQNGYFVFMPDITYLPRNPGKSAVDCLEPALQAVFARKVGVNPEKVGLIGHSWGGYQTAYVTTVSKMFAVGVAGAPLTELTSMYNSFYWNSGVSDQVLFEISQGRMEVPFWEDAKAYIEISPVWRSSERKSPLLLAAGDADGAVDYHQSLYLYQTLRRMGKPGVLLLYAGENHNFAKRANQLDYGTRLRHYLDVYLKGAKPEPWISAGIPLIEQKN